MPEIKLLHENKVIGILSGFDRLIFRGGIKGLLYEGGFAAYLNYKGSLFLTFNTKSQIRAQGDQLFNDWMKYGLVIAIPCPEGYVLGGMSIVLATELANGFVEVYDYIEEQKEFEKMKELEEQEKKEKEEKKKAEEEKKNEDSKEKEKEDNGCDTPYIPGKENSGSGYIHGEGTGTGVNVEKGDVDWGYNNIKPFNPINKIDNIKKPVQIN